MPATILRIAGVYDDLCQSIPIAHQIQRIYEREITGHFYPGDLDTRQSFVHLDDLLNCIVKAIESQEQLAQYSVFLVGEESAMSYRELQDQIALLLYGEPCTTFQISAAIAKLGAFMENLAMHGQSFIKPWMVDRSSDNYELDIALAKNQLHWSPKHQLQTTLPRMIEGLYSDPYRWYEVNKLHMPTWLKHRSQRKQFRGVAQH